MRPPKSNVGTIPEIPADVDSFESLLRIVNDRFRRIEAGIQKALGTGTAPAVTQVIRTTTTVAGDWEMRAVLDFPAEDPIAVETDVGANHYRVCTEAGKAVQLVFAFAQTKLAAAGDLVFDLLRSRDANVSSPGTWASLFHPGYSDKPRALSGTCTAPLVTAFAVPYLYPGDLVRLDVLVGSNSAVSGEVTLYGREVAAP